MSRFSLLFYSNFVAVSSFYRFIYKTAEAFLPGSAYAALSPHHSCGFTTWQHEHDLARCSALQVIK